MCAVAKNRHARVCVHNECGDGLTGLNCNGLDWTGLSGLDWNLLFGLGGINRVEFNLLSITFYLTVPMKTGSATVTVPGQSKSPCPKSSPSLAQLTIKPNHSRDPTFSHHTRPFPFIQAQQHKHSNKQDYIKT